MDPATIAVMILSGAVKAAELATQAIAASRAGDDAKAMELLNQAVDHYEAGGSEARDALDAANARVDAEIDSKFPETP